eukprot:GILI01008930.1.p1 GENE.GILI01008930.1~~GILI01008930.1.p1  ORF type:complete len:391 (-),score=158.02 GILI01008930.1:114-1286(-)
MDLNAELQNASKLTDPKRKADEYKRIVSALYAEHKVEELKQLLDHLLAESSSIAFARNVLQFFAAEMEKLTNKELKKLAKYTLLKFKGRTISFEEEEAVVSEHLGEVYQADLKYLKAAKVLAAINLDSGVRSLNAEQKGARWIRIAELYIEGGDEVMAEPFVSRVQNIVTDIKDKGVLLKHKYCKARIQDGKKQFLDAAKLYYELSQQSAETVVEEDLLHLLSSAIVCAVLSSSGPLRTRMLATLIKDERVSRDPNFEILKKMFMLRFLRRSEVLKFASSLKPHHLATLPDGSTVLDRAVVEHNMSALSRIYHNISFSELAALLEISSEKAEKIAAKMIANGALQGSIDQVRGLVEFNSDAETLGTWDTQIAETCVAVNSVLSKIAQTAQ